MIRALVILGFGLANLLAAAPAAQTAVASQTATQTSARERELDADEDPLSQQLKKIISGAPGSSELEIYGSVQLRYRQVDAGASQWEDNGSRLGANGWVEIAPSTWLFGRYELGFHLLEEFGTDSSSSAPDQEFGDSLFTRIGYLGIQRESGVILMGKNWSTYYKVAEFTDRFDSLGGEAHGVYNANTDGGPSGTGRADQVLQTRLNIDVFSLFADVDPLSVNVQLQYGEPIPEIEGGDYDLGFGISTIVESKNNVGFGIAYNRSWIDLDNIPPGERRGLDGDMSALLVGARWFDDDRYLGVSVSRSRNLVTTDKLQYFKGIGVEFYGQYRVSPKFWLIAGLNHLEPDNDQDQAKGYRLRYGVLGARYSFDGFSKMLYLESRLDSGSTQGNKTPGDQFIAGLRWNF